ncbi:MAG: hypothetical protein R3B91_04985 [Planctomycetaceae bacterium]
MFHPSVTRLFWKEFRTQWQVWLALIVGTFLLQLLFLVPGSSFVTIGEFPFYVATTLTYCFAATCGALLFAGEREGETFVLLQSLPISTGRFVMGKVLFAILSVITFGAVAAALGAVVWSFDPAPQANRGFMTGETLLNGLLPGILGCLLWSMFFSLLLSRVMVVIVCAVVTEFAVTGLITNPLSDYAKTEFAIRLGTYAALAAVDFWLMGRWLRNEPLSLPWEGPTPSVPRRDHWSVDVSLATVRWASARHTLGSRTFAVLIWRELKTAVPFILWWGLLGVFLVDLLVRWGGLPGNFIWLYATPGICGLMTCLGDQRQQSYRFLSHRGLSSLTVWLSKHLVWLIVAFGLVLLFGWYDYAFQYRSSSGAYYGKVPSVLHSVFDGLLQTRLPNGLLLSDSPGLAFSYIICLGCLSYAVGHLCSLWFRGPVIASAVALIVTLFLIPVPLLLARFDIPLAPTLVPLVLAIALGTLSTTSAWLRDESSWSYLLKRIAWVVLPVIACVLGVCVYRGEQIPEVDPGFDWQAWEDRPVASSAWMSEWKADLDHLWTRSHEISNMLLADEPIEVETRSREAENDDSKVPQKLFEDRRERLAAALVELERLLNDEPLPLPSEDPSFVTSYGPIVSALEAATALQGQRELEDVWHVLRTSLCVTEYTAQSMPTLQYWYANYAQQIQIHAMMRRWANDENQTVEQLDEAIQWFNVHEHQSTDPTEIVRNQYVYLRRFLTGDGGNQGSHLEPVLPPVWFLAPLNAVENDRMLRLLNVVTRFHLHDQTNDSLTLNTNPEQIDRWQASVLVSNAELRNGLGNRGRIEQDKIDLQMSFDVVQASRRATELVMRLRSYRLREGRFPDHLNALPGERTGTLVFDPLGGHEFGYAPDGLELSYELSQDFQLAPGQPVIWSTSPNSLLALYPDGTFSERVQMQANGMVKDPVTIFPEKIQYVILRDDIPFIRRPQ